jgi:hypothetical protein
VFALAAIILLVPSVTPALAADPLQVQLITDKSTYNRGESVQLTLSVKNTASYPIVVTFTTAQQYDFTARDASGSTVWTWSLGRVFSPLPSQKTIAPGETWTYSQSWAFATNLGQRLEDGPYTLRGTFMGEYVGKTGPAYAEQTVSYFTPDYLQVSFSTDKSTYERYEQAALTMTVTNTAPYSLTVSFPTAQQYDFTAVDAAGNVTWAWSAGKTFDPSPTQRTLAPGEVWVIQQVWNFRDNAGAKALDGDYTVSGTFLGNYEGRSGAKGGAQVITLRTSDPLNVTFSTNKTAYKRLESARLTLRVTNVAPYAVTITFPTSQLYEFTAHTSSGTTVWTWSRGKTFTPGPVELTLGPDEAVDFTETWSLVDNNGLPLTDGTYTVKGTFLGDYFGKPGPKGGSTQIRISTL